jgi:hypothetical protein
MTLVAPWIGPSHSWSPRRGKKKKKPQIPVSDTLGVCTLMIVKALEPTNRMAWMPGHGKI